MVCYLQTPPPGASCTLVIVLSEYHHHFYSAAQGLSAQICSLLDQVWQPTPVLLPGKSHGRRSLVGCSPCGRKESDTTEQLHFHFSLSCIGEGNGNPLQCSCLENARDSGAWWAAIYRVAQSWTRLKRLGSSSSSSSRPGIPSIWKISWEETGAVLKTTRASLSMEALHPTGAILNTGMPSKFGQNPQFPAYAQNWHISQDKLAKFSSLL